MSTKRLTKKTLKSMCDNFGLLTGILPVKRHVCFCGHHKHVLPSTEEELMLDFRDRCMDIELAFSDIKQTESRLCDVVTDLEEKIKHLQILNADKQGKLNTISSILNNATTLNCKLAKALAEDRSLQEFSKDFLECTGAPYRIILQDTGERYISVIKALRQIYKLGLKEAKDISDLSRSGNNPIIEETTSVSRFKSVKKILEAEGATVAHV